jgi:ABC-type phosphate transport system substrate-binding protein
MNFKKPNKLFKSFNWKFTFFCAIFLFFSGIDSAIGEGKIVAITHENNSVSSLNVSDLQKMYRGNKLQWDNGEAIKLILPPSNCEEMEFIIKKIFKFKSQVQIAKYYLKAVRKRKWPKFPEATSGTTESILKVAQNTGAIALIDLHAVEDYDDIKLITIVPIEGL